MKPSYNSVSDDIEIYRLLLKYFDNDSNKVNTWIISPNIPMFGGVSPFFLICANRSHKVLAAVKAAIEGY